MSLAEYARKRDFRRTAEPEPARAKQSGRRFVIQKHAASRLHYDFRLELGGTLKSWAVPKGVPFAHGEKRLAVQVEDHPVAYIDFEGVIPKGQYGSGTVMVWDAGTFEPLSRAPLKDLRAGKLHFVLHGEKLEGEWYLVRLKDKNQWLLVRGGESIKPVGKRADDTSVRSGESMEKLAHSDRVWTSKSGKSNAGVPKFVPPMQAKLVSGPPANGEWTYEIKFDGFRALALLGGGETHLLSRNEKDLGAKFPDLREALGQLDRNAILDGEIVALDAKGRSSFQLLQAYELGEERPPLYYYAFDLLRLDGRDLRGLPLPERKAALEKLLGSVADPIRFSAGLGSDAAPLLDQSRKLGLEGLIGKRLDSRYESGRRSGAWIKLKLLREQEFVIGGYTDPGGSRKHLGALIVGVYDRKKLRFCGKVGTGFSHALLRSLSAQLKKLARPGCPFSDLPQPRDQRWGQAITAAEMRRCHWVKPTLVAQVKFSEWTRDGHLRQPVFLGLREDKPAREVRMEKADPS